MILMLLSFSEPGGSEAKEALKELVENETVYLNIDDLASPRDPYNRIIAVVYKRYNSTDLLNVNKWLVDNGYANITDYADNEFDPYTWELYVYYPESNETTIETKLNKSQASGAGVPGSNPTDLPTLHYLFYGPIYLS